MSKFSRSERCRACTLGINIQPWHVWGGERQRPALRGLRGAAPSATRVNTSTTTTAARREPYIGGVAKRASSMSTGIDRKFRSGAGIPRPELSVFRRAGRALFHYRPGWSRVAGSTTACFTVVYVGGPGSGHGSCAQPVFSLYDSVMPILGAPKSRCWSAACRSVTRTPTPW